MIQIKTIPAIGINICIRHWSIELAQMMQQSNRSNQAGTPTTGQRRRFAVWLLLGWASFWLAPVFAQVCCAKHLPGSDNPTATIEQVVGRSANSNGGAPAEESDCPEFAMPDATPVPAALASPVSLDPSFDPPLPSIVKLGAFHFTHAAQDHWLPPPAALPVYLRLQRLLI